MTVAANLIQAAGLSYDNCFAKWTANTLKVKLTAFWQASSLVFDQNRPNDVPPGNWISILATLASQMAAADVPFPDLNASAQYVYRLCWLTQALVTQGLLTNAQGVALLAAYNAQLGS